MIARWMFGSVLFSALVALAALALERALRATGRPTRWPWALAMGVASGWPVIAPFVLTASPDTATIGALGVGAPIDGLSDPSLTVSTMWGAMLVWVQRADPLWRALWISASAALFVQLLVAIRVLRQVRHRAHPTELDGESVLVDAALGPAVVGLFDPRIVVPTWLLELDGSLRTLVLRHEREHCRAGDPALVWLSAIMTTALPWNPVLWWMASRLRAAMEIDCDARTVRTEDDRARYAKLLLLIAQQKTQARFIPMLSTSTSQLSRRISAMHQRSLRHASLRALAASTIAPVAIAAACSPRIASNLTSPTPVTATTPTPAATGAEPKPTTVTPPYFDFQVERPATIVAGSIGPRYPDSLRTAGVQGDVLAQFVVNTDGSVDMSTLKVLRTAHAAFSESVRAALVNMRFTPALVGDRAVRQLVQAPFSFALDRNSASAGPVSAPRPSRDARATEKIELQIEPAPSPVAPPPSLAGASRRPAKPVAGSVGPQYPQTLRDAKVEGEVMVQFVVDANGKAEMSSLKVLRSSHVLFTQAVREALAQMTFEPAEIDGRKVKQLMQTPFQFSLSKD